jgi:hypothetical protein
MTGSTQGSTLHPGASACHRGASRPAAAPARRYRRRHPPADHLARLKSFCPIGVHKNILHTRSAMQVFSAQALCNRGKPR